MNITQADIGKNYSVLDVGATGAIQIRLRSMGFIRGSMISVLRYTIRKQTYDVRIGQEEIALRVEEATTIEIAEHE